MELDEDNKVVTAPYLHAPGEMMTFPDAKIKRIAERSGLAFEKGAVSLEGQ